MTDIIRLILFIVLLVVATVLIYGFASDYVDQKHTGVLGQDRKSMLWYLEIIPGDSPVILQAKMGPNELHAAAKEDESVGFCLVNRELGEFAWNTEDEVCAHVATESAQGPYETYWLFERQVVDRVALNLTSLKGEMGYADVEASYLLTSENTFTYIFHARPWKKIWAFAAYFFLWLVTAFVLLAVVAYIPLPEVDIKSYLQKRSKS